MLKHYGHWGDFLHKNVKNLTRTLMNVSCEQSKSVGSILYMVLVIGFCHFSTPFEFNVRLNYLNVYVNIHISQAKELSCGMFTDRI